MTVIRSSIKGALLALTGAGLLLGGSARAAIAILDGGTNAASTAYATNGISLPFTVSSGASVLVVTLFDANVDNLDQGPALYWTNNTTGIATPLSYFTTNTGYGWSCGGVYYLTNPVAGTGVVGGVDTNEVGVTTFMQVYTLAGVDTTVAPVPVWNSSLWTAGGNVKLLSATTPSSTVSGSWVPIISWNYNGGGGHGVTNLSSSGTVVQNLYRDMGVGQIADGYIQSLWPNVSTISAQADQKAAMAMVGMIFTPLVSIAAPINVAATSQQSKVKLTWTDASGGRATGYIVLRSTTSGSGYSPIATNSGNSATTYNDTSVVNYTSYYYVVEAIGTGGVTSPYSSEVTGYALGLPGTATGLAAAADVNQVDLSWTYQAGPSGYNILRSTTSGNGFTQIGTAATNSYIDASVAAGMRYYYEVVSMNTFGSAPASSQVSAIPVVKFFTNWIGVFNSDSDVAPWYGIYGSPAASVYFYAPPDITAPPAPSAGCLDMEATYGPSWTNNADYAIAENLANLNLSGYQTLEMDIQNPAGSWDQWGQLQAVQMLLQVPVGGNPTYEQDSRFVTLYASETGGDWTHYVWPLSDWSAYSLADVTGLILQLYDGNCLTAETLDVAYANIAFCGAPAWRPTFTVANETAASGSTSVTLSGKVSGIVGGNPIYLASNTVVSVTIHGSTQTTAINDATGDFSVAFNTTGLADGAYQVTYSTPDDMVALVGATNNSTTLTFSKNTTPTAPTIQPVTVDSTGANLVVKVPTQSGYTYYLLSTTKLTPPVVWTTNTSFAGTGATITTPVPINKSQGDLFLKFLVH
jgi:hypothetical protein